MAHPAFLKFNDFWSFENEVYHCNLCDCSSPMQDKAKGHAKRHLKSSYFVENVLVPGCNCRGEKRYHYHCPLDPCSYFVSSQNFEKHLASKAHGKPISFSKITPQQVEGFINEFEMSERNETGKNIFGWVLIDRNMFYSLRVSGQSAVHHSLAFNNFGNDL